MHVKNQWYVAAQSDEVDGNILARRILDESLVIFRTGGGHVAAMEDRCLHRFAPLSMGKVVGETIECCYHGARYDAQGQCVYVPGQANPPKNAKLKSFRTFEEHGYIWIWMGDPERMENEAIPGDSVAPGNMKDWVYGQGHFESFQAGYKVINDNLIDITHVETIHHDSFACKEVLAYRDPVKDNGFIDGKLTYEVDDKSLVLRLQALNMEHGPFMQWMVAQSLGLESFDKAVDFELEVRWLAPSTTTFLLRSRPAGEVPDKSACVYIVHLLTPESATSCHYFYNARNNFSDVSEKYAFLSGVSAIFEQDKGILEAQQKNIGSEDLFAKRPVSFSGDFLQVKARKIIENLEKLEAQ